MVFTGPTSPRDLGSTVGRPGAVYRFQTVDAGNAIAAAVNGAQDNGADIVTLLEEHSHAAVRGVVEANGDAKTGARVW